MRIFLSCLLLAALLCADALRDSDESQAPSLATLYAGAASGDKVALDELVARAAANRDYHWLQMASKLGTAEADYQLAMQLSGSEQLQALRRGAKQGHGLSQYELALLTEHAETKLQLLVGAAEQGIESAVIALYQWHLLQNQSVQALPWLEKAAGFDPQSALLLAKTYWRQGKQHAAVSWFKQILDDAKPESTPSASSSASASAKQSLAYIQHFINADLVKQPKLAKPISRLERQACPMRLQFVADSLDSLHQAGDFARRFMQDERLQNLPICMDELLWLPKAQLQCNAPWQAGNRITCDLSGLSQQLQQSEATHAVILTESGKANVHNGVMYLDLADDYHVFVHELAHFVGFVDEYPVSAGLAEQICSQDEHANIIVRNVKDNNDDDHDSDEAASAAGASAKTPEYVQSSQASFDQKQFNQAMLAQTSILNGTDADDQQIDPKQTSPKPYPAFSYKTRTCNHHERQAYKSVDSLTFMEFNDQPIPLSYLATWQTRLENTEYLTPMYVNFAQTAEQKGLSSQAQYWWGRYAEFQRLSDD